MKRRPRPRKKNEHYSAELTLPLGVAKWVCVVAVGLGVWLVLNRATVQEFFRARVERNENSREVAMLEREKRVLEREKRQLDVGGFTAEKTIRERFRLVRPGERIIIIHETAEPETVD